MSVAQIGQAGKHFHVLRIQPREILMVTLDEGGWPRHLSILFEPGRKVARTVMMACCLVDPARIGPYPEVADLQDLVKANAKRYLELEHVLIQSVHCSVNVAGGTDEHRKPPRR